MELKSSKNSIKCYSAPEQDPTLKEWHEIASADHFWFQHRQRILFEKFGSVISSAAKIADIGCGKCMTISEIDRAFGKAADGFDLNDEVLRNSLPVRGGVYLYDFFEKHPDFKGRYDLILLLDVLEHLKDDKGFLETLAWHQPDGGKILINVPANQALFSKYDEAVGHHRRYDVDELRQVIESSGYRVLSYVNWGYVFVPLVWVRKLLAARQSREEVVRKGIGAGVWTNRIFRAYSRLDIPLRRKVPGTSLTLLAQKI